MDFCKYMHILNFMPETRLKKVGTEATTAVECTKKTVCIIPQVDRLMITMIMIRLWHHDWVLKGILKRLSLSQARMQRGSPLCENCVYK